MQCGARAGHSSCARERARVCVHISSLSDKYIITSGPAAAGDIVLVYLYISSQWTAIARNFILVRVPSLSSVCTYIIHVCILVGAFLYVRKVRRRRRKRGDIYTHIHTYVI